MNFFTPPPYQGNNGIPLNNQNISNDLIYHLNELENKIKKLEQRIIILENSLNKFNVNPEPDNSLYML